MALKKDKGICIRAIDYSESSQILTFFTKDSGKISVIAKGSRRPKSSFSGPIEICSAGDLVFSHKEGEKLGTLTEYNPTFFSAGIRKKLFALNCSFFAAELLNLFTKEFDAHPELYQQAINFLENLEKNPDDKILPFLIVFEFSLLAQIGSQPLCDCCANCKRKFDANWNQYFFSISAGGFVCRDCESAFVDKNAITFETASYLALATRGGVGLAVAGMAAHKSSLIQIEELLIEYMTYVLEKRPRTATMILKLISLSF